MAICASIHQVHVQIGEIRTQGKGYFNVYFKGKFIKHEFLMFVKHKGLPLIHDSKKLSTKWNSNWKNSSYPLKCILHMGSPIQPNRGQKLRKSFQFYSKKHVQKYRCNLFKN